MRSPLDILRNLLSPEQVDSVHAPVGAWISPQATQTAHVGTGAGGHPVMAALEAQAHNQELFHGMAAWAPVMGLAFVLLAVVWTRFLRG